MGVKELAESVGGSEDGLRLLIGQLCGYPIMLLHRFLLANRSSTLQHLYFFLTGFITAFWVLGTDVAHSIYAIFGTYLILVSAGGSLASVVISFLFNFLYLLVGYWYTESDSYDICWTMSHCILCLRLIGLTFDCYDGKRAEVEGAHVLSKDQEKAALPRIPNLLEILSHSFFIGGHFVGPQFTFKKYSEFASPDYQKNLPGSPLAYGFKRLSIGVMYMAIHLVGSMYVPVSWPGSDDFNESSFLRKMLILPFWVKIILSKYLAAWLTAEGVCIVSGLSFNGIRESGKIDWKGCANVKLGRLESSSRFGHLIEGFNVNTNAWAAAYIYKRLKFMNNRLISQFSTLFFLAMWHGFHTGYYVTFFNEFITMNFEKEFLALLERSERMERLMVHPAGETMCRLFGWLWVFLLMPHCFIPFSLLSYNKYLPVYRDTYFLLYAVYLSWPLWRPAMKSFLKLKPKQDKKDK